MAEKTRWFVNATITRWVDIEPQPGIVECKFADAFARRWAFIGKFYDFTDAELDADSEYPQAGYVICEVLSWGHDASGRVIAEIDTSAPDRGFDSLEGPCQFVVFADQLAANALPKWQEVELVPTRKH